LCGRLTRTPFEALFDSAAAPFVFTPTWAPRYPLSNTTEFDAAWAAVDAYAYMAADDADGGVNQARLVDTLGCHT